MKRLRLRRELDVQYSDAPRIVASFARLGYEVSEDLAIAAWETYSDSLFCASWLFLPDRDEDLDTAVRRIVETFMVERGDTVA